MTRFVSTIARTRAAALPDAYLPLMRAAIEAAVDRRVDRERAKELVESALRAGTATAAVVVGSKRFRRLALRGGIAVGVLATGVTVGVVVAKRHRRKKARAAAEADLEARAAQAAQSTSNQSGESSSGSAL